MDETAGSTEPSLSFGGLSEFLGGGAGPDDPCQPGTRLGDVTLVRLIGVGGMGRVFEGRQQRPHRAVAVKLIRAGLLSAAAAKRFDHEAHILGRLSHPAIAQIYSAGIETIRGCRVPFFVMELIEGGQPLTHYANCRDLGTRERVSLFKTAVAAVAHGHQRGIVHRDLKPGNILVAADGQPKVIDFGVARGTDGDIALTTGLTDTGQLVGTLQYMSPEQFVGTADDLDVRADVYSLGILLYELLAGRPPYDVRNRPVYEATRIIAEAEPRPLSSVSSRLRGDLTTIVATCLDKDRSRRYSSAAELEADLGRYLRGEPIVASPPGLSDALRRIYRRHRTAAITTLGIVIALILGVIGTTISAIRAERQRQLAVTARQQADSAAALANRRLYVANMRALQATLASKNLRQARRLFAENASYAGTPLPLELRCLTAGLDEAAVVIRPGAGPVTDIAWNPTAGAFAVRAVRPLRRKRQGGLTDLMVQLPNALATSDCGEFHLYDAAGSELGVGVPAADWMLAWQAEHGDPTPLARRGLESSPVAISRDGGRLAVQRYDGSLQILNQPTGEPVATLEESFRRLRTARFVAGNDRLLIETGSQLTLWDATSGRRVFATASGENIFAVAVSRDGQRLATACRRRTKAGSVLRFEVMSTADGGLLMSVPVPLGGTQYDVLIALSPGGDVLYGCSNEQTIHAWETATARQVAEFPGHRANVSALAAAADGRLASGSGNGHVRLWDVPTATCLRDWVGHDGAVLSLAFTPDGAGLASGSHDGTVRLWQTTARPVLAALPVEQPPPALAFSPDGRRLAVGVPDRVSVWDTATATRHRLLRAGSGSPSMLAFSPDGHQLAAAYAASDGSRGTAVWRLDHTASPQWFPEAAGHCTVQFSPDGATLVTTTTEHALTAWSIASSQQLFSLRPQGRLPKLAVMPAFGLGGQRLAFQPNQIIDGRTGLPVTELASTGLVTAVAASPDGRLLATGLASGRLVVRDFATGQGIIDEPRHVGRILSLAISADGRLLASSGADGTATISNLGTGGEARQCLGHEGRVDEVIFTPDSRRLITASQDGTVRIWDVASGQELLVVPGSGMFPTTATVSPAGDRLVTVTGEKTDTPAVRIWGLTNAEAFKARLVWPVEAGESGGKAPQASRERQPDQPVPAG